MLRVTRWSPDTCGCVLEFEWDDTQPESSRTHTYARTVATCPAHSGQVGPTLLASVKDENTRKNRVVTVTKALLPATTEDNYLWWFDASRVLNVTLAGVTLTPAQKTNFKNLFDSTFGAGKVRLV